MAPPHGVPLKDTGERGAARTEQEAHMFECWNKQGGPGWELREKVDSVHSGFIDMTATIRTWGRAIAGAVTLMTLAVALLGYLQMREKERSANQAHTQPQPSLIKTAHAETKEHHDQVQALAHHPYGRRNSRRPGS